MINYLDQTNEDRSVLFKLSSIRDNTYISITTTDEDGESFPILLDESQTGDLIEQLQSHLTINI